MSVSDKIERPLTEAGKKLTGSPLLGPKRVLDVRVGADSPTASDAPQYIQELWAAAKWLENVSVHKDPRHTREAALLAIRHAQAHLDTARGLVDSHDDHRLALAVQLFKEVRCKSQ